MSSRLRLLIALGALGIGFVLLAAGHPAMATEPEPWQIGLTPPASPVMDRIVGFHGLVMYIITAIVLLVLALLVYVVVKFNAGANPVPTKTTHNAALEIAWTLLPVLILVLIAVPSFRLLFFEQNLPPADLTLKAIGNQWNWTYQYPDNGNFEFTSIMLQDQERKPDQPRLLAVNEPLLVPVNKVVRVQATADPTGVIHSFTVPAFGFKIDAIPGRLNEIWFKATREGTYYGQCSELCGRDHAFMPIEVHVVSDQAFAAWVDTMKTKYPTASLPMPKLAAR